MIFFLIAGTYTPVALLALNGSLATTILIVLWAGALGGVVFKLLWIDAPKWLFAITYIALGWVAVLVMPQVWDGIGFAGCLLLIAGGIAYTVGGIIYATERPNPRPAVFGYHEVFHALTIVAVACQYVAISFFVIQAG